VIRPYHTTPQGNTMNTQLQITEVLSIDELAVREEYSSCYTIK